VAGHAPGDLVALPRPAAVGVALREVLHRPDGESGRAALDLPVGQIRVSEPPERVIADVQHPLGQATLAGDGEVPGQVEIVPLDPGLLERREDVLHLPEASPVDLRVAVTRVDVRRERGIARDDTTRPVAHRTQRDDVPGALGEVGGRTDDESPACGIGRVGVEFTQYGVRLPVLVSSSTIGASSSSDLPISVIGAAPVRFRSTPGTLVRIGVPGLKPSLRFHSVGSIGVPATFRGIIAGERATRRPVPLDRSATVKWSFGNGSRQAAGSIGSQPGRGPP
jgi:hypothetical protein